MRALITGIAGMIGSHLAERLLAQGWEVDGIDNLTTGRRENLPGIDFAYDWVRHVNHYDVGKCDAIFHLAAHVGPDYVVRNSRSMLLEHGDDARTICRLAQKCDCPVVLASTSEVYSYNKPPFKESDNLVVGSSEFPRAAYAVSKLNMEHIGLAYHREYGVKTVIARIFNCVGPRQREKEGFVLPIFARQALTGQPITVHGDGTAKRCFTHVKDTVEALIALATKPECVGEIVNIASGAEPRSIIRVAAAIADHCARTYGIPVAPIQFVPYPDKAWEQMRTRVADVSKLERLTGLAFGDRWDEIVADVCADQARQLGIRGNDADKNSALPIRG